MSSNLQKLTQSLQAYTDNKSYNSVIFSVNTVEELYTNQTLQGYVSNGLKCFVKTEGCEYKYYDGKWTVYRPYERSINEPKDKSVIWIDTSSFILNPTNTVTLESLLNTINTLISRIDLLTTRIEILEAGGGGSSNPDNNIIDNVLLIEDGCALLLDDGVPLLISHSNIEIENQIIDNVLLIEDGLALLTEDGNPILYK